MNGIKKFLLVFAALLFVFVTSCTGANTNHSHAYTDWVIEEQPTATTEGFAKKYCNCGEHLIVKLPILSDELVWTKSEQPSTCEKGGQIVYSSIYGEVVEYLRVAEHEYSDWTITVEPTLNDAGSASRKCIYGETETVEIAKLSDKSVWSVSSEVESTCTVHGNRVYTSVYGSVTTTLELADHAYGEWTITVDPKMDAKGAAIRKCEDCGEPEEVEVPALSDAIWTIDEQVKANYNKAGYTVYSSVYGKVKAVEAKLVAPYDNKTYSSFAIDQNDDKEGFVFDKGHIETAWNKAVVTLDENGKGPGINFPFRGYVEVEMVDEATGKVKITKTDITYTEDGEIMYDEDGNLIFDYEDVDVTYGYVDFESGIIVSTFNSSFNYIIVWVPFEVGVNDEKANASSWENSMVCEYTFEDTKYRFFIDKDVVRFGVSFVDELGAEMSALECYKSDYVYVKDAKGEVIKGFVNNGEKLVVVDGFEGTYKSGENTLVVSGYGKATLNGVEGTYVKADSSEYTIGLYVGGEYHEVTLAEGTYTSVKPMVTVTFVGGEFAEVAPQTVNKNIAMEMPKPDHLLNAFKGWYYDEALTSKVEEGFAPTKDVTLYAMWKTKVIINLVGTIGEDAKVLYLGEGDVIGNFLPKYHIDLENGKVFKGWYLDESFETSLPEEAEVTESDSNITLYAKWADLPVYYGKYYGTELWSSESGNYQSKYVNIDENGTMKSDISKLNGIVVSYDPETQVITFKQSETATTTYSLWFDAATGVMATHYSNMKEIGSDFYIFTSSQESGKVAGHFGVYTYSAPGASSQGYYAHFVNLTTKLGQVDVFLYNNHIYSNISIANTLGEELTTSTIKNSKTVIVKDSNNETIIAVASLGDSFKAQYKTVLLDNYFGTYTKGDETIVLDGTGIIVYGEKTGTYEAKENGLDVYLENNTEYYVVTLNGSNFEIVKPMVTLTFIVGEGHTPVEAKAYNKNVVAALPSGEDAGYVFNGWYLDQEFTSPVPANYVPTQDVNIYAKYSAPAILTIVYNNGSENDEVIYSVGDIATIEMPIYAKHAFVGWYTTEACTEGSEWTNGVAINEDITIYAKWEVAPIYNNTYAATEITGKATNGSTSSIYTRTSAILNVDPYGKAPSVGYPFNKTGGVTISDYNPATGEVIFMNGTVRYDAYIDANSGIIVMPYTTSNVCDEVYLLSPFETKSLNNSISSSYWNSGATRVIEYTYQETVYRIFVMDGVVYFGVTFEDATGNNIVGKECYNASVLYVYASDETLIAKFGYDGETMQKLDGYEGTYVNGTDSLVIDGVKVATLNGVAGSYKLVDGAFTADFYIAGEYYELTLDKATYTYTVNKPYVQITFEAYGKAEVEGVNVNKNIAITLPTPTNDAFIFRGWYLEESFDTIADVEYVPTTTLTLYAKWDAKVSLTVVYGKGIENAVLYYGVGDVTAPVEPAFTDGQVFDGWYLDSEYSVSYTPGEISESITIYAKWKDAIALYGSYKGFEIWGSSKAGGTSYGGTSSKNLTVDVNGKVTGNQSGEVKEYDPATGRFKLYTNATRYYNGYYDAEVGMVAINYSSGGDSLGNDIYIYFKNVDSALSSGTISSYWNSGYDKIIQVNFTGGAQDSMFIFVHNDMIYTNVSYTSTDGEVTPNNLYKANQVSVFDEDGNLIASFVKGANGLELVA